MVPSDPLGQNTKSQVVSGVFEALFSTENLLFMSGQPVPKTLKWRIIIVDTFSARAAPEWKSVSYHVEHGYLLVEVCVINKC